MRRLVALLLLAPSAFLALAVLALILVAAVRITGIATSRVYLGPHYPADVAVFFLLGLCWAWSCARPWTGWRSRRAR